MGLHCFALIAICFYSISKMRENCLQQFEAHWNCLELNNQVSLQSVSLENSVCSQLLYT
jgi:hypothetical protein